MHGVGVHLVLAFGYFRINQEFTHVRVPRLPSLEGALRESVYEQLVAVGVESGVHRGDLALNNIP